jgi:hypothetical protein
LWYDVVGREGEVESCLFPTWGVGGEPTGL